MAHGFAIELLRRFSCPEECHGFPSYDHRYCPATVTTSVPCFQKGYLVCIYRAWSLFFISSMCSLTIHLADPRPHSPTTPPTSPPSTQAPSTGLMLSMAKFIMHRHVCIAFFSFPFVNWAHITSRFSLLFSR